MASSPVSLFSASSRGAGRQPLASKNVKAANRIKRCVLANISLIFDQRKAKKDEEVLEVAIFQLSQYLTFTGLPIAKYQVERTGPMIEHYRELFVSYIDN